MVSRWAVAVALVMVASGWTAAHAETAQARRSVKVAALPPRAAVSPAPPNREAIPTGEALPPIGWVQFCDVNLVECMGFPTRPSPVELDDRRWSQLVAINDAVNDEVAPRSDLEQWGLIEKWSFPDSGEGDCEDYVLEKRRRLIAAGWPRQALLITVVRDHRNEGHAVLTVRSDRGDYVLDNQAASVKRWDETGYRFIKRQSEEHPARWVGLGGVDTLPFTARRGAAGQ